MFVVAACVALIPFWVFMGDNPRNMVLFAVIALTVYIVHLNLAIKTLTLASLSIAREAVAENWDSLVMTGIDGRKIVLAKWVAVLGCVWRDYAWASLLRLGLAYGLAKYFDDVYIGSCYRHLAGGLCYYNSGYPYYFYTFDNPFVMAIIIVGLICLMAFGEAGLLAALGICFGSLNRQNRMVGMTCAAIVRGILVFMAIFIWIVIGVHSRSLFEQVNTPYNPSNPGYYRWNMNIAERQALLGSAQIVLSPLADSGTLLVTDLIRPTNHIDNLVQRLMTGAIALSVFGGLIWLSLRAAELLAVRQRALRPRESEFRAHELAT
jgi:hypothetical protein